MAPPAEAQASQCACEVRNPQGSCYLGNVQAVVRTLREELLAELEEAGMEEGGAS